MVEVHGDQMNVKLNHHLLSPHGVIFVLDVDRYHARTVFYQQISARYVYVHASVSSFYVFQIVYGFVDDADPSLFVISKFDAEHTQKRIM